MAKRRVQVGRLRAPTSITPVARTVDTYISPKAVAKTKTKAEQLYDALAPGVSQIIDKRAEEDRIAEAEAKAKFKREEAQRIAEEKRQEASRQAFEAKLKITQGDAAWNSYYEQNKNDLIGQTPEQVLAKRKEIYQPFVTGIEDQNVLTAVDRDFQLGGIIFDEKFKQDQFKKRTDDAITTMFTAANTLEVPQADFNNKLNENFKDIKDLYNVDMKTLNDYGMSYALQRVKQGDYRVWEYMKAQKQDQVGDANRQQVVAQITDEIARQNASQAKEQLKQTNATIKDSALQGVLNDVDKLGSAAIQYPVYYTEADGTEKTLSTTEMEYAVARNFRTRQAEYVANNGPIAGLARSVRDDWAASGLVNKEWKAVLESNISSFIVDYSTVPEQEAIDNSRAGYMMFETIYAENPKYAQDLLSEEDFRTYRAVSTMIGEQGMTYAQSYERVRSYLTGDNTFTAEDTKEMLSAIKDRSSSIFGDDVNNTTEMRNFIERNAETYMMNGLDPTLSVEQAVKEFDERFVQVGNRMVDIKGVAVGLPKEKTEAAFNLILQDLPEGTSFQLIPGQNTKFRAVDEVGIPVYQTLDDGQIGMFSVSTTEMKDLLNKTRLIELADIEAAAKDSARLEQLIDQRGEQIRNETGSLYTGRTWLSRFNLKLQILEEERVAREGIPTPLTEMESNPFAIQEQ